MGSSGAHIFEQLSNMMAGDVQRKRRQTYGGINCTVSDASRRQEMHLLARGNPRCAVGADGNDQAPLTSGAEYTPEVEQEKDPLRRATVARSVHGVAFFCPAEGTERSHVTKEPLRASSQRHGALGMAASVRILYASVFSRTGKKRMAPRPRGSSVS